MQACPDAQARCILDNARFARNSFPDEFGFLVDAPANSLIKVSLFFAQQDDAGFSTKIFWNEPGCVDSQFYDSQGLDIFQLAGDNLIFEVERTVEKEGEHLIEVFSDARAEVVISVTVQQPRTL